MSGDLVAPEPADPPLAGPERIMLEGWLEYHRATLLLRCDGLADEQRKRRPVATSLMSLHGMVRHLADVERNWFQRVLGQKPGLPAIFGSAEAADADWVPLDGADWAADVASWQAECAQSRLTAAAHGLDDVGVGVRGGRPVTCSLRWIYNHMIEEYARHNGHADLIRELVVA
ncbi:MAG: multi-domain protein [Actinomycetia bacterium]|nr:multi-domain protein [Actinomycetes bacterium]